jgi:hypothetical protein
VSSRTQTQDQLDNFALDCAVGRRLVERHQATALVRGSSSAPVNVNIQHFGIIIQH